MPPIALVSVMNCALICNWGEYTCPGAFLVTYMVKNLPVMQEVWVQSLSQEDPLEKGMVTHSSVLAWKFPWTEEPGRLQSMESQRVRHGWATSLSLSFHMFPTNLKGIFFLITWCNLFQSFKYIIFHIQISRKKISFLAMACLVMSNSLQHCMTMAKNIKQGNKNGWKDNSRRLVQDGWGEGHAHTSTCESSETAFSCWTTINRRMWELTKKRFPTSKDKVEL